MKTLVSIDWDFFTRHGMYEKAIELPNGEKIPALFLYDWQMSESRGAVLDSVIWTSRVLGFSRLGLDIRESVDPIFTYRGFLEGFGDSLNGSTLEISNTHTAIWLTLTQETRSGPVRVVNFDAHHDLGYDISKDYDVDDGNVACDTWAYQGLYHGHIAEYVIVYPDWLGLAEWEDVKRPWLKKFKDRIQITTWSEYTKHIAEDLTDVAFLCKSSAWTPPWLDNDFVDFASSFDEWLCLDCFYHDGIPSVCACTPREWDWDEVNEVNRRSQEALARLTNKRDAGKLSLDS